MKLEKKDKLYILFIVLLSFLFVGLLFMTVSGWFYKDESNEKSYLTIGQSAVIEVGNTKSAVLSYNLDGSILASETIKFNLLVKNSEENDVYLRVKINIFSGDNDKISVKLKTNSHWTNNEEDEYYYFDETLLSLETIGVCSGLYFDNEKQLASKTGYILTITIESLSVEFDKQLVWGV